MTPSETAARNAINAAAAAAAIEHGRRIRALPRWRQWLISRLLPPYPMVMAEMPAGEIELTRPLEVAPGVAISGAITRDADARAIPDECP